MRPARQPTSDWATSNRTGRWELLMPEGSYPWEKPKSDPSRPLSTKNKYVKEVPTYTKFDRCILEKNGVETICLTSSSEANGMCREELSKSGI